VTSFEGLLVITYSFRQRNTFFIFSVSSTTFGINQLLVVAVIYRNPGLIMLEVAWMVINAWGLWKVLRKTFHAAA